MAVSKSNIARLIDGIPPDSGVEAELREALGDALQESMTAATQAVAEANKSYEAPPPPPARLKSERRQEVARQQPARELIVQTPVQRRTMALQRDSSRALSRVAQIKSDGATRRGQLVTTIEEVTRQLLNLEEELKEHDRDINERVEHQLLIKQSNEAAVASMRQGLKPGRED